MNCPRSIDDARDLRSRLSPRQRALLNKRLQECARRQARPVTARISRTQAPLSFAQQRLWFLDQLAPGQPLYNLPQALRLRGPLNVQALQRGLTRIVQRHEALRTRFETRNGEPVQLICAATPLLIPIVDLQSVAPDERELELHRQLLAEAQRPFDLQKELVLRAMLLRLGPAEHVLLITLHHIASDAWSLGVLFEELTALYNGFVRGRAEPLPELPMQYADYAVWQRDLLQGEVFNRQLSYWREQLAGAPALLDVPCDRPRSGAPGYRGATRSLLLTPELASALSRLARDHGATLFMTLLAAFQTLLHRYTGQEDIVIGSPMAGRNRKETEPLIGCFLNTVVLRSDLSGAPTFRDLLQRVRNMALSAYAHQDLPFEKLVEELQPERDPHRNPFFHVMFTVQDSPASALELDGIETQPIDIDLGIAPFDLTLLIEERADGLLAAMEYKTDLFDEETIGRMLGHFRVLLEGIVYDPGERISYLPIIPAEEKQRLMEFNPTEADFPRDRSIHELFEAQAARKPEAMAVSFGDETLTYGELNERANGVARYLQSAGIRPGALVGISMKRSPDAIVALLGILKAGAAYVPLDAEHPRERTELIRRNAGINIVLTHLPQALKSSGNLGRTGTSSDVAYAIHTSGSTGVPKGVLIEHRALVNQSTGFARQFELTPSDRVLQFAPLTFDVSAEEIFPTLLSGGAVVLRPDELATSPADFHDFIVRERLTIVNLPTPYWDQWMDEMEAHALPLPPFLRVVIVGSDVVTPEQYARWRSLAGGRARWCNAYGVTEAAITSTIYEPEPGDIPPPVSIGRPVANARVYVLDRNQQLAPLGIPGELCIAGEGLARGYLNDPEATARRFVPDPFGSQPDARLLRTGDMARWRTDGNLEFLGRIDEQVKIRGFRIELGEVESVLRQHALVRDAVVSARQDDGGEKRLVAYVVPHESTPNLAGTLSQFLRRKLPGYMAPSALVTLPELPLLASGKVNRNALPAPGNDRPELAETFVAPADDLEEQLAAIWCKVLGIESVGVHDNFFDLGGHSLMAVRLVADIESLLARNLPVAALFRSPTIRQLAGVLRDDPSTQCNSVIIPLHPQGSRPPLFLVHGAGGGMLWGYANLARYLDPDQPVYCFNSPGMDGLDELARIEDMAAHYVRALREFQPSGPYVLGGYCFGGEVAFEMAQQLSRAGERVEALLMFNAMPPNSSFDKPRLTPAGAAKFIGNSARWFRYFCQWTPRQRYDFVKRKWRLLNKACSRALGRGDDAQSEAKAEDWIDVSLYPQHQLRLWDIHLRASAQYRPQTYPGRVTVFRTRIYPFLCSFDHAFGWREFAQRGVSVKVVPGTHESILDEPHVRHLAREVDGALRHPKQLESGRVTTARRLFRLMNFLSLAAASGGLA